jgi:hypothetical protein
MANRVFVAIILDQDVLRDLQYGHGAPSSQPRPSLRIVPADEDTAGR